MKLTDVLENVVNLDDVRNRKRVDALSKEFDQYERLEISANEAFDKIHKNISSELDEFRIPGFKGIDDLLGYLLGDVGLPRSHNAKVWQDWIATLPKEDVARVQMIGHHAPRLFNKLQAIIDQLNAFDKHWTTEFGKLPTAKAPPRVFDLSRGSREELWEILTRLNVLSVVMPQLTK